MNETQSELVPVAAGQLATAPLRQTPSVGDMLAAVIEKGVTSENVAAIDKLVGLYERMQDREAERQFAAAFLELQRDMPSIVAVKAVPLNNGGLKYKYAPLEEIMPKVMPALSATGFTVTFTSEIKDGRVSVACTLLHVGGHHKTNISMARIGSGPQGASETQADGAAATYAKRRALCDALAIVAEIDTDGKTPDAANDGAPISRDQAQCLRELVLETKSDEARFLKYAGADTYEGIGSNRYEGLFEMLNKKAHG